MTVKSSACFWFPTMSEDDDCKVELSLLVVYHSGEEDAGLQDLSVLPGPCVLTLMLIQ